MNEETLSLVSVHKYLFIFYFLFDSNRKKRDNLLSVTILLGIASILKCMACMAHAVLSTLSLSVLASHVADDVT